MTELVDYELNVLKALNGDQTIELVQGAALNATIEFLQESGYIYGKRGLILTDKGERYLDDHID